MSENLLLSQGLLTGIVSASLYTWRLHYDVTYEEISRTFVVEGIGTAFGAVLYWSASTLSHCCQGEFLIGFAMVIMAAYPCYHSFIYFLVSGFVFGIAKGLLFVGKLYSSLLHDRKTTQLVAYLIK